MGDSFQIGDSVALNDKFYLRCSLNKEYEKQRKFMKKHNGFITHSIPMINIYAFNGEAFQRVHLKIRRMVLTEKTIKYYE